MPCHKPDAGTQVLEQSLTRGLSRLRSLSASWTVALHEGDPESEPPEAPGSLEVASNLRPQECGSIGHGPLTRPSATLSHWERAGGEGTAP